MREGLEIHYADNWAAVYEDGVLVDGPGDSYLRIEWLLTRLGVREVHDDSFMRGQSRSNGAAQTLDEVDEYKRDRKRAVDRAEEMRAEADELLRQAAALEEEYK